MRRSTLFVMTLLLGGCDSAGKSLTQLLDTQMGVDKQTVIFTAPPRLETGATLISVHQPLKWLGRGGVCVALANGATAHDVTPESPLYHKLLGGKELTAALVLKSGRQLSLDSSNPAWNLYGELGGKGELSACMWGHAAPAAADPVVAVSISNAARPISHLGVYWHTESDLKVPGQRS